MNPVGIIMIVVGLAFLVGNNEKKPKQPVRGKLTDSLHSELDELDRLEQQLREEVQR